MTSDERLIETLKNIKDYCHNHVCKECKFSSEDGDCEIQLLCEQLNKTPWIWDMKEIKKIVKEEQK